MVLIDEREPNFMKASSPFFNCLQQAVHVLLRELPNSWFISGVADVTSLSDLKPTDFGLQKATATDNVGIYVVALIVSPEILYNIVKGWCKNKHHSTREFSSKFCSIYDRRPAEERQLKVQINYTGETSRNLLVRTAEEVRGGQLMGRIIKALAKEKAVYEQVVYQALSSKQLLEAAAHYNTLTGENKSSVELRQYVAEPLVASCTRSQLVQLRDNVLKNDELRAHLPKERHNADTITLGDLAVVYGRHAGASVKPGSKLDKFMVEQGLDVKNPSDVQYAKSMFKNMQYEWRGYSQSKEQLRTGNATVQFTVEGTFCKFGTFPLEKAPNVAAMTAMLILPENRQAKFLAVNPTDKEWREYTEDFKKLASLKGVMQFIIPALKVAGHLADDWRP
ncbi:hypothetical protein GPECTOR_9g602 [Gonium pectorale]|uniref:Uncharacterized protein n=1 Tax=Gonium pectorale TaxID=33097 RepID=A0A150GS91_GONPE|nr:hypothetical protein GPECTOR_9g602 [Gonium pectorale]|eukprot:KXZ52558.1 hypothetical protein GPECTOR_9g602 [Gonium pectorale]